MWEPSLQRLRKDFSFFCNKSIVQVHLSGCCCDVSLRCDCLIFVLQECDQLWGGGGLVVVCSLFFWDKGWLDPMGFGITYEDPGVMVVKETCPRLVQMI